MQRLLLLGALPLGGLALGNLNGDYVVATSGGKQDVPFNVDYASRGHEYFDVWAPEIATHYAENFWTDQHNQALPAEIVKRFAGKVIAVTGYEMDMVMVEPTGRPGENPEKDVSVPINWAYNHHYAVWVTGNYSRLERNNRRPAFPGDHSYESDRVAGRWKAVDTDHAHLRADPSIPTSQFVSEGNGGESRKSFHGYPDGFAQLIESPDTWHITPMQIDTRNRDCGVTRADVGNCTTFTPGPEPRQARYGRGIPKGGTNHSGILECPCTSRFGGDPAIYGADTKTKKPVHISAIQAVPQCPTDDTMGSAEACFAGGASLTFPGTRLNKTVSDPSLPPKCSVVVDDKNGVSVVYFNTDDSSTTPCQDASADREGQATSRVNITLRISLEPSKNLATMTLTGPSNVWFGVGFDAKAMRDQPYTLVVTDQGVQERLLGTCGTEAEHCPGDLLAQTLTVQSMTVENGMRTAVVTRSMVGKDEDYYSFEVAAKATIPFITAKGSSMELAYHAAHGPLEVSLATPGRASCLCDMGAAGELCDHEGNNCTSFIKQCVRAPFGSLAEQDNPTCTSRSYAGGLSCCGHQRILLDADQEVRPELLRYHMKFRFWFQEYVPAKGDAPPSHYNLERVYQQTEANAGEYDVPPAFARADLAIPGYPDWPLDKPTPGTTCTGQCPDGPDCACEHEIHYYWNVSDLRLIYISGHCHAPSCLSLELYRNDTGELLCRQVPHQGQGRFPEDKWDEAGYISIAPCLVGPDKGLAPSVLLPKDTTLHGIKRNDNTHVGHFGEMASWQMRGVYGM